MFLFLLMHQQNTVTQQGAGDSEANSLHKFQT